MPYISLPRSAKNITGQRFGRLIALGPIGKTIHGSLIWRCQCDCGSVKDIDGQSLRKGLSQSCGCFQRDITQELGKSNTRHGAASGGNETPEFKAWLAMKGRCYNPNFRNYKNYGGRGISVCKRWLKNFENFLADVGLRPSPQHSLDRIDNNGNYCPENCRWATAKEQTTNRRNNRIVTAFGRSGPLVGFMPAGFDGGSPEYNRVLRRLNKGWSVERALAEVFGKK